MGASQRAAPNTTSNPALTLTEQQYINRIADELKYALDCAPEIIAVGGAAGVANTYTVNSDTSRAILPTAAIQGKRIAFYVANANTGPSTLIWGSINLPLLRPDGNPLQAGDLKTFTFYEAILYSTNWWIITPLGSPAAAAGSAGMPSVVAQDLKANNTPGGTATAGSWFTRTITVLTNNSIGASLAASEITLPAGTYYLNSWCASWQTGVSVARIYNSTDAAVLLRGPASSGAAVAGPYCVVSGMFTISAPKNIRLEMRVSTTKATDGQGVQANFGDTEVYSQTEIWKMG